MEHTRSTLEISSASLISRPLIHCPQWYYCYLALSSWLYAVYVYLFKSIFIVNTFAYSCESKLLTSTNQKKENCIEHIQMLLCLLMYDSQTDLTNGLACKVFITKWTPSLTSQMAGRHWTSII